MSLPISVHGTTAINQSQFSADNTLAFTIGQPFNRDNALWTPIKIKMGTEVAEFESTFPDSRFNEGNGVIAGVAQTAR